jgi:hypothetical protein
MCYYTFPSEHVSMDVHSSKLSASEHVKHERDAEIWFENIYYDNNYNDDSKCD